MMSYIRDRKIEYLKCEECNHVVVGDDITLDNMFRCERCNSPILIKFCDGGNAKRIYGEEVEEGDYVYVSETEGFKEVLGISSTTIKWEEAVAIGIKGFRRISVKMNDYIDIKYTGIL